MKKFDYFELLDSFTRECNKNDIIEIYKALICLQFQGLVNEDILNQVCEKYFEEFINVDILEEVKQMLS